MRALVALLAVATATWAHAARADETPLRPDNTRVAVEIDPLPLFEHGYSVHAVWKPGPARWLRFSLGVFGTGSTKDNWNVEQRAYEASVAAYPFSRDRGLFVGVYTFLQRWQYRYGDLDAPAVTHWFVPAPAVGFQFMPWNPGPYITPWAALGFPIKGGTTATHGHSYDEPKLEPFLAVHIGWEAEVL